MAVLETLNPLIPTTITISSSGVVPTALGLIVVLEHSYWTDRVRAFTSTSSPSLLGQLTDAGVPYGAPLYRAFSEIALQPGRPATLYVGRREPGDANWATALDAIRAASDEWYGGVLVVRDSAEILEAATWQSTQAAGAWIWQTLDNAVYTDAVGNLAEQLAALPKLVGTLLYHDPATASGAAAPSADTSVGPWALTPGNVLSAIVDGSVVDTYTHVAATASVTGSNTGPFVGADGQTLSGTVETVPFAIELDVTPASATSAVLNNYDLTAAAGNNIIVETDTGTDTYALFSGAAPGDVGDVSAAELAADFVAAVTGTVATASASGGYPSFQAITSGTDSRFRFGAGTDATFLTALGFAAGTWYAGTGNVASVDAYTATEIATLIQSDIGTAGLASDLGTGALTISGSIRGTASDVTITAGTAALLTALGLSAGSTAGSGDVANAASVGAVELDSLLTTAFVSGDVSHTLVTSNTAIHFEGTTGVGKWRNLRFVGGLRSELGLTSGQVAGMGTEDDHADATWFAQILGANYDTDTVVNADNRALVGASGDSYTTASAKAAEINMRENMDVSTLKRWSARRRGPETHDGRCTGRIDGEVVYLETIIYRDWLALRLQEAVKAGLDRASDSNQSIPYTTDAVTAAVVGWVSPVFERALANGGLAFVDLTPPDPANGKITGLEVVAIEASTSLDRSLRRARVLFTQQLAGSLQRAILVGELINA